MFPYRVLPHVRTQSKASRQKKHVKSARSPDIRCASFVEPTKIRAFKYAGRRYVLV